MQQKGIFFPISMILAMSHGLRLFHAGRIFWIVAYGVTQASLIFLGSWFDDTLILEGVGKGFFEHYGVWSILITDPLIILGVGVAHAIFRNAFATIRFENSASRKSFIKNQIKPGLHFLYLNGHSRWIYIFLVVLGILAWVNNVYQTMQPTAFYGNDVFDQIQYRWGFLTNKINLLISWVIIYPAAGFLLVSMCILARLNLNHAIKLNGLKGSLFHPDQCYGFANLGWLNISLLLPYFCAYIVIFSLTLTHEAIYQSLVFPFSVLSVLFIFVSFWTISPVVSKARDVRRRTYSEILSKLNRRGWELENANSSLSLARICLATTKGSPYSEAVSYSLIFLRLVPILLSILRLHVATSA